MLRVRTEPLALFICALMSLGKTNGEAFQLNERKCKKLKTIFSNSEDALEAISDHKVVLSSLNIQIFEMECACCSDLK